MEVREEAEKTPVGAAGRPGSRTHEETPRYGRYTVLRRPDGSLWELGRGKMGVNYKAFDASLKRVVALKLIQDGALIPQARERFLREARTAAQLTHPHVATVYDVGSEGETDYLVMEFIEGESVDVRLKREQRVSLPWVLCIGEQVTRALEAAARRGILHRDIKPGNLMLVGGAEEHGAAQPFVKLIDFGLARLQEAGEDPDAVVSTPGMLLGTPAYASPEQCEGRALDTRSDIYSLGATLWHLLTGKHLFQGTPMQVATAHLTRPPAVSELEGQPPPVTRLFCWMLAKDREDRPADPLALRLAIERVRADLEMKPGAAARPPDPAKPPGARVLEAYQKLAPGDVFSGIYRLREEMPVPAGRRRFRAEELAAKAGGFVCLEIMDPCLGSNPKVYGRLCAAVDAMLSASPVLWTCSAIACDAASGLRYVVRAPTGGRTLLDLQRQRVGVLKREEIHRLLNTLPAALDSLNGTDLVPPDLRTENFLVEDESGTGMRFDALGPRFEAGRNLLAPNDVTVILRPVTLAADASGGGFVPTFARLIYDLSGGSLDALDRSGYRPTAAWDENGNNALRSALDGGFSDCVSFWHALNGASASPKPVPLPQIKPTPFSMRQPPPEKRDPSIRKSDLGMRFHPVPATAVAFSVWPTRVSDYAAFAAAAGPTAGQTWREPGFTQAPDHPVVGVNCAQAEAFCRWLTDGGDEQYRLPTDAEWSVAVGLTEGETRPDAIHRFPWGGEWPPPRDAGQYAIRTGAYVHTAPVGSFRPNAFGLYDLGGNVWEWCTGPQAEAEMLGVLRGGSWNTNSRAMALSGARQMAPMDRCKNDFGFRIVKVVRG